jgi:hypothetical protein
LTDEEAKRGNQFRPGEHAAKNSIKGNAARREKNKARKTMAELAAKIAAAPISNAKTKSELKKIGLEGADDLTNQSVIVAAVYMAAASGDMKAVEKWQELTETMTARQGTAEEDALSKSLKELGEGLESDGNT